MKTDVEKAEKNFRKRVNAMTMDYWQRQKKIKDRQKDIENWKQKMKPLTRTYKGI